MSLEQEISDLSAEVQFVEYSPTRAVVGATFQQGIIDYQLSVSGYSVWHVGRSYIRLTCSLTDTENNPSRPTIADMVALAYNSPHNLFDQASLKALNGGGMLSQVQQSYPQIAALAARTLNSDSWSKAQGYVSIVDGDFTERQLICAGLAARAAGLPGIAEKPGNQYLSRLMNPAGVFGGQASDFQCTSTAAGLGATFAWAVAGGNTPAILVDGIVGTTLVFNGTPYTIVLANVALGVVTLQAYGSVTDGAASADWYFVARKYVRADLLSNEIDIIFRPCLGPFVQNNGAVTLASGEYQLTLVPSANYKLNAVEMTNPYNGTLDHNLTISDMRLYACMGKVDIPPSIVTMTWNDYEATSRVLGTTTSGSYQFTVRPSTCKLYVFLQTGLAGGNPNWPPSNFRAQANTDLMIQNLTVTYAGESQPLTQINSTISYLGGVTPLGQLSSNTFKQLYYNHISALGVVEREAGVETYQQWLDRGPIHCFDFSTRNVDDRSTQVDIKLTLAAPPGSVADAQTQLFLVSEFKKTVSMSIGRGKMVGLKVSSD